MAAYTQCVQHGKVRGATAVWVKVRVYVGNITIFGPTIEFRVEMTISATIFTCMHVEERHTLL